MKKRIGYIDMAKGLAIILVIIGHISFTPELAKVLLYLFHIPLFFFLSGFTFSIAKYPSIRSFLLSKIKTIVIPFFILNIFVYAVQMFVMYPDQVTSFNPILFLKRIVLSDRLHDYFQLWFLNVLFLAEVLSYFVVKNRKGLGYWISIFSLLIVGVYAGQKVYQWNWALVWNWDLVPAATVFLLLGFLCKENLPKIEMVLKAWYLPIAGILCVAIGLLNYKLSGNLRVDLYYEHIGNHFLFYISAICGIWATLIFFKVIPEWGWLKSIGQKTLIYYGVHSPIVLVLVEKLVTSISTKYNGVFVNGYITSTVTTILTIIGCELIVQIFRGTNFPFGLKMIGEKNEQK